ncbi:MAG: protein translocase subunit SecD [Chloroflexi bacterium]|nr:protein translocase subunit SecD [Chloroflexota bacterium]
MYGRMARWLLVILIVLALDLWINWPGTSFLQVGTWGRDVHIRQGLDLQGGLQVLLEADVPDNVVVTGSDMQTVRTVIENRVNGLGVTEPIVQVSGTRRILVELPGFEKTEDAIALIKETGLLEFVDAGTTRLPEGASVMTDARALLGSTSATPDATATVDPAAPAATPTAAAPIYHTVMTGAALDSVSVSTDKLGSPGIDFKLTSEGSKVFAEYTSANVGTYLAIVLDGQVISSPVIKTAITDGQGQISGNFTIETANQLAVQLRYGALPVPLRVARTETVGPSLGQDSLRRSMLAGAIGLGTVILFMLLYYRLPGFLADLALALYALTSLSIYRLLPVTFTLPGIAGFILSVGMAVDANVLIFERLKEELRAGRSLQSAVETGWSRAWPSIRDSNISTLITCSILIWFGGTFGASIVKGFALTLAIGVLVSMFTAIIATRTLLHLVLDRIDFSKRHGWFGV